MRHSLLAALTLALTCPVAFASTVYTGANAKVTTNVDASFFDSVTVTDVPTTASQSGYSVFTLYKSLTTATSFGWLDVTITSLQDTVALTSASSFLSVLRPGDVSLWMSTPTATMEVHSPVTGGVLQTQSSVTTSLVNIPLLQNQVQSFDIMSASVSGSGWQWGACGEAPCSVVTVFPKAALTLTIRVSNVPELSSGTMSLVGALAMPLAMGLRRMRRQGTA